MPILYYTTTISPHKTLSEVQEHLARVGAKRVGVDYDNDRKPDALLFMLDVGGTTLNYRMPCNWHGMLKAMLHDESVPNRYCNEEQAMRTGWRIIKVWVEAQTAMIQAGLARTPEVFLPYLVGNDGRTLYEHFADEPKNLLR